MSNVIPIPYSKTFNFIENIATGQYASPIFGIQSFSEENIILCGIAASFYAKEAAGDFIREVSMLITFNELPREDDALIDNVTRKPFTAYPPVININGMTPAIVMPLYVLVPKSMGIEIMGSFNTIDLAAPGILYCEGTVTLMYYKQQELIL